MSQHNRNEPNKKKLPNCKWNEQKENKLVKENEISQHKINKTK